ncbi:MAG: FAD-dependent oxidoreductase [Chloroflexota bacterium]
MIASHALRGDPPAHSTAEVVIIGAGVISCAIAAPLSRTTASVVVLEAAGDVGEGASKGNADVAPSCHAGPGALEARLIADSCHRRPMPRIRLRRRRRVHGLAPLRRAPGGCAGDRSRAPGGAAVSRITVVGAGLSGLAAAAVMAARHEVVLADRLPAIGGLAGREDPEARRLDRAGRDAASASSWKPPRSAANRAGSSSLHPATSAGSALITSSSPAGRVRPPRPIHVRGDRVRVPSRPGSHRPDWADDWLGTGPPRVVHGHPRNEALEWSGEPGGPLVRTACDALVLAAPARTLRNVEDAIRETVGVTRIATLELAVDAAGVIAAAEAAARPLDAAMTGGRG